MRVLGFTPLRPDTPKLWWRTVESVMRHAFGLKRLEGVSVLRWVWSDGDNPHDGANRYLNVLHNYRWAREQVLAGDYDALFCVECDMVLPPDALTRLIATGADVAYGLYVWRHSRRLWSAYTEVGERVGRSLSEEPERARELWGRTIDVAGVGLGCTLIRRRVLEALEFRLDPILPDKLSNDWMLARDCQRLGFTQRCDLGVVCGHATVVPDPRIYWPDPNEPRLYRIQHL